MAQCNCGSLNTIRKGTILKTRVYFSRHKCKDCGANFYKEVGEYSPQNKATPSKKYVITSAQTNSKVNNVFLQSLKTYCKSTNSELVIIPVRSAITDELEVAEFDSSINQHLLTENLDIHPYVRILGGLRILATAENPIYGIAPLSKGKTIIIGHGQVQMTSLPVQQNDMPVTIATTGSITNQLYSETKVGAKAAFNHCLSAIVVEPDDEIFHLRYLNFDGEGFYDLDKYYSPTGIKGNIGVSAIVLGDEHVMFVDEHVKTATFGSNGLINTLKPSYIVRHDILDCYSISHHHRENTILKFKKYVEGTNDIEKELHGVVDYLYETTPSFATNVIVPSNHVDHLTRWLNECEIKHEPWNALLYHNLMYNVLLNVKKNKSHTPFEIFAAEILADLNCNTIFLDRCDTFKIKDVEVAIHGDIGANGARGSRKQFSNIPSKCIIGHSHSPGIEKGCYQVGTSSKLQLEYNKGPSSWMHTHCIIHNNGKRQLVSVIHGKWRA